MSEESKKIEETLTELGYAIESSGARGEVRGDWPCMAYAVQIFRNKRMIWTGAYRMGTGYRGPFPASPGQSSQWPFAASLYYALKANRNLVDKQLVADASAWIANRNKVRPPLADVIYSLLSDASGADETFSDWCGNYGYSDDSIKAREIYDTCRDIASALRRGIPAAELKTLEILFKNY